MIARSHGDRFWALALATYAIEQKPGSSRPNARAQHIFYSKRATAKDLVYVGGSEEKRVICKRLRARSKVGILLSHVAGS